MTNEIKIQVEVENLTMRRPIDDRLQFPWGTNLTFYPVSYDIFLDGEKISKNDEKPSFGITEGEADGRIRIFCSEEFAQPSDTSIEKWAYKVSAEKEGKETVFNVYYVVRKRLIQSQKGDTKFYFKRADGKINKLKGREKVQLAVAEDGSLDVPSQIWGQDPDQISYINISFGTILFKEKKFLLT